MTEFTAKARKLPDAAAVDAWMAEAHRRLRELEPLINGINVFPVRDRDTGTNLRVTFESARTAPAGPMDETWGGRLQAVASAASKDALGNSGTVLVIVLSSLASRLECVRRLDAPTWSGALSAADVRASSAISDRAEATIFDVLHAAASCPPREDAGVQGLLELLEVQVDAARDAVVATLGASPALARYQVIDAGAVGLLVILEALRAVLAEEEFRMDVIETLPGLTPTEPSESLPETGTTTQAAGVEVVCTVDANPLDAALLRATLDGVGESVIMTPLEQQASDPDAAVPWRIHVHVAEKSEALEAIAEIAPPRDIHVSSLADEAVHTHANL